MEIVTHRDFATNVRDVHSKTQLTFTLTKVDVVLIVKSEISGKGRPWRGVVGVAISEVGVDPTHAGSNGEFLAEHERIGYVNRHFVGFDGESGTTTFRDGGYFAQREVTHRSRDSTVVSYTIVAGEIGQSDVVDQLSEPRGIAQGHTRTRDGKRVFSGIPIL